MQCNAVQYTDGFQWSWVLQQSRLSQQPLWGSCGHRSGHQHAPTDADDADDADDAEYSEYADDADADDHFDDNYQSNPAPNLSTQVQKSVTCKKMMKTRARDLLVGRSLHTLPHCI